MRKRVLVVDACSLTRKGFRHLFEEQEDFELCGEADGWRDALLDIPRLRPDVIVAELKLRDGSGWELVRRAKTGEITAPILVLTCCDEKLFAVRLLKEGARGFLMKNVSLEAVMNALRRILAGHIAVSDEISTQMVELATHRKGTPKEASEWESLSDRELQVLELLCQQKISKEIADCMGISEKTVSTYKTRLMDKINVRTTAELLARMQTLSDPVI